MYSVTSIEPRQLLERLGAGIVVAVAVTAVAPMAGVLHQQ